jgi:hypothetical protein
MKNLWKILDKVADGLIQNPNIVTSNFAVLTLLGIVAFAFYLFYRLALHSH